MLGRKSTCAEEAFRENFIGADFGIEKDLSSHLSDNWRDFNKEFIPIYLKQNPTKTKISAGLSCGMLWTIAKGIQLGDIVLCPDGKGGYYVGEVAGMYEYKKGQSLPHRRAVRWFSKTISREEMSESLRNSSGSIGTVSNISKYAVELEMLLSDNQPRTIISTDDTIEDSSVFALEKHLEDFLVQNWKSTDLGKRFDIYEEDGEIVGQQYPCDTGLIKGSSLFLTTGNNKCINKGVKSFLDYRQRLD